MHRSLLALAALASVLALPLAAHADAIDDFVLTGGGHTISYSLPATSSFPAYTSFDFFMESAPTTIDGVSGYIETGSYNIFSFEFASILFSVPSDVFGSSSLSLFGPSVVSFVEVPADNPSPYLPFNFVTTFVPGTYDLQLNGTSPILPPESYTLTITPQTATAMTPEPSSLLLLATGFFGFAALIGKKRRHLGWLN